MPGTAVLTAILSPRAGQPANARRFGTTLARRLALLALLPLLVATALVFALVAHEQLRGQDARMQLQAGQAAASVVRQLGDADAAATRLGRLSLPEQAARVELLDDAGRVLAFRNGPDPAPSPVRARQRLRNADGSPSAQEVVVTWSAAAGNRQTRAQLLRTAALLGLGLAGLALVGWWVAMRTLAPLGELSEALEQIGRGQQAQVKVRDDSVLARLQQGVNEASQALANARNRMEAELGRTSMELADRNARLGAASQARSRFLAAASHDLRQPLYALTLFSSSLRAGEEDPQRLSRIGHIEECVASLDHLFSELLDLSRLESGAMHPVLTDVALDEVFDETSRNFRMLAETRGLRLVVRKTDAWVRTDRTMLGRILNNLVSNALRYTSDGGVLIGVRRGPAGRVRVDVCDTGCGIRAEEQQRVFDEFYQVARERTGDADRRRGMGLGLSTVRKLAQLVDCVIHLESQPGRGTTVSLDLPAALDPVPASLPAPVRELPLDVSGMRVLVIDDEPAILEGLRALLAEWDCSILAAEDQAQAMSALDTWPQPPDLVISDLRLRDGRSGVQVLHALAARYDADPNTPPFARLLVTGETKSERLSEVAASHIPVLFKPVAPGKLREAMVAAVFAARLGR